MTADAGSRAGKVVPYKPLLDRAIGTRDPRARTRGAARPRTRRRRSGRRPGLRLGPHCATCIATTACRARGSSRTRRRTSSTPAAPPGRPKGVQRDTGGHAVALATSIRYIFDPAGADGAVDAVSGRRTFFAASDIGWVVGHCYIVYAPLLAGMATVLYEGTPIRGLDGEPDPGVWWRIVAKHRVNGMFTAPTAIRVLKKQDPSHLTRHDLSSLDALFLAGEPLDEPTARWIADGIQKPILDNYWQTETGWPMLSIQRGLDPAMESRFGSPGKPVVGYRLKLFDEETLAELPANEKGVLRGRGPAAARMHDDRVGRRRPLRRDLLVAARRPQRVLGRSTGASATTTATTSSSVAPTTSSTWPATGSARARSRRAIAGHPAVAETAVVGVADALKGQVAIAFAILRDPSDGRVAVRSPAPRRRSDGDGRPRPRRARAAGTRALRLGAAEDAFGQDAAPGAAGRLRRPQPRRPHHHRRPGRARSRSATRFEPRPPFP